MSFGLNATGFNVKRLPDIIESMQTTAQQEENFGADFDLRDGTPQGQFFTVFATELADMWEQLGEIVTGFRFDQAIGNNLAYNVKLIGVRRNQAIKAGQLNDETITFTGDEGTEIPINFIVSTPGGVQFKTKASATIPVGLTVNVLVEALIAGESGNVSAGTVTVIDSPLAGVSTVTNANPFDGGSNQETDEELRERARASVILGGRSTTNSIRSTLLAVANVQDALVRENDQEITVGGLPPKSIAPVVLGGTDEDVANAIFNTKSGGIQSFGTTTVPIVDESGATVTIGFSRPTNIDVWVNATVTTNSDYPANGNDLVQAAIVNYINGLDINQNVILFDMIVSVGNAVDGITNLTLETSTDGVVFLPADVTIGNLEKAITENAKVVIS